MVENIRVAIVQVPLIGMEGCPNPGFQALKPGEGAGVFLGENLTQVLFVSIRNRAVRVDAVHSLIAPLASNSALCPFMLVGGVVDDQVDDQADAFFA